MIGPDIRQRLVPEVPGLLRYARTIARSGESAEDLVQETLLRAWKNADILDESQGSVRAWLFTVARNIVIDESRTRRYSSEIPVDELPEPAPCVEQSIAQMVDPLSKDPEANHDNPR